MRKYLIDDLFQSGEDWRIAKFFRIEQKMRLSYENILLYRKNAHRVVYFPVGAIARSNAGLSGAKEGEGCWSIRRPPASIRKFYQVEIQKSKFWT